MHRQPNTVRLESLYFKEQSMSEKRSLHQASSNSREVQQFRMGNRFQRHRNKTEPMDSSSQYSAGKEKERYQKANSFSEEYLDLVNKLKGKLTKGYFQRKRSRKVIIQKERIQSDDKYEKSRHFSIGSKKVESHYQYCSQPPLITGKKKAVKSAQSKEVQRELFKEGSEAREAGFSKQRSSLIARDNVFSSSQERLARVREQFMKEQSEEETEKQISRRARIVQIEKKFGLLKQERKRLLQSQPQREQVLPQPIQNIQNHAEDKLDTSYPQFDELCFHVETLLAIFSIIKEQEPIDDQFLLKKLKLYVIGNKKYIEQSGAIIKDDISHLETIYKDESNQRELKNMVFLERVLIVLLVDLVSASQLPKHVNSVKQILENLLGLYIFLVFTLQSSRSMSSSSSATFLTLQQSISLHNLHYKKQVSPLSTFINRKLTQIMKANPQLSTQLKQMLFEFFHLKLTINRSFYELLKLYAIYLNTNDHIIERYQIDLKTFATCPSPYITRGSLKTYSLVLGLEGTLIHAVQSGGKIDVCLRPFAREFMELMAKDFEIIVFAEALPSHCQSMIEALPGVSHCLYRFHATRVKGKWVKDVSRLGRPLSSIVMIDHHLDSCLLNGDNSLQITEWVGKSGKSGRSSKDQELSILGLFLSKMVKDKPLDVRDYLSGYGSFREQYS